MHATVQFASASREVLPESTMLEEIRPLHDLVNDAVRDLGVICVGVEDHCLFFEVTKPKMDPEHLRDLASEIVMRLESTSGRVREALHSVKTIRLSTHV
jgi:hypothetical protein